MSRSLGRIRFLGGPYPWHPRSRPNSPPVSLLGLALLRALVRHTEASSTRLARWSIRPKRTTSLAPARTIGSSAATGIARARSHPGRRRTRAERWGSWAICVTSRFFPPSRFFPAALGFRRHWNPHRTLTDGRRHAARHLPDHAALGLAESRARGDGAGAAGRRRAGLNDCR